MGIFGNQALDDLFGEIFGASDTKTHADQLYEYWKKGEIKQYYYLLNRLKQSGYHIYRRDDGKHIVKKE